MTCPSIDQLDAKYLIVAIQGQKPSTEVVFKNRWCGNVTSNLRIRYANSLNSLWTTQCEHFYLLYIVVKYRICTRFLGRLKYIFQLSYQWINCVMLHSEGGGGGEFDKKIACALWRWQRLFIVVFFWKCLMRIKKMARSLFVEFLPRVLVHIYCRCWSGIGGWFLSDRTVSIVMAVCSDVGILHMTW